jgi:hypothetical protein
MPGDGEDAIGLDQKHEGQASLAAALTAQVLSGRAPGSNRRKTQEPLESSTIFESVVIVAQLTVSVPLHPAQMSRLVPRRSS